MLLFKLCPRWRRTPAWQLFVGSFLPIPTSIGAGDIARECKVPQNTMSTHLAILTRAGLLHVERDGRQMNYQADLDGFRAVVVYLAKDCCNGRSDLCASLVADIPVEKGGRSASPRSNRPKPAEKS